MIPRKLRKLWRLSPGLLVAGVPVAMIHRGIDAYIERQASEEVRLAAQRAVARAEWRIGQVIAALGRDREGRAGALRATSMPRRAPHRDDDNAAQGDRGRRPAGVPRCLPAGSDRAGARPVARPAHRRRSRVSRGGPSGRSGRAGAAHHVAPRRRRRCSSPRTIPADVFLPDGSSSRAASDAGRARHAERRNADRGAVRQAGQRREDGDSIRVQNQSTRYPLIATATVSRAAVFAEHGDLRAVGTLGSGGCSRC